MSDGSRQTFLGQAFQRRYRELTLSAMLTGIAIGVVMNAAITYSGLKIGFTIVGSAIAAVLGFAILRVILRRGSIVEVNIVQTIATSVNTSNAGVIFTLPALILLGIQFNPWLMTVACIAGAVLGAAFIVPARRQMIDLERLRFPSGTAVAAILRAPGAGAAKALVLLAGALLAALIYLPTQLPQVRTTIALDRLDEAVANEIITAEDAERTRRIAGWIETRQLPEGLVAEGRDQIERLERTRAGREEAVKSGLPWVPAADSLEAGREDALAVLAARIHAGEADWSALRGVKFWASKPLPGYGSLGLRGMRISEGQEGVTPPKRDVFLYDSRMDIGALFNIPASFGLVLAITPLSFAAGFLTGRPGLVVTGGGLLAFVFISPLAQQLGLIPPNTPDASVSEVGRTLITRPMGIGMLMGGALMGILAAIPAMRAAFKGMGRGGLRAGTKPSSDELPIGFLAVAVVASFIVLFLAAHFSHEGTGGGLLGGLAPWVRHGIVAVIGTVWIWFAGIIIAQCTGMTDWSPISGLALITVLFVMIMLNEVVAAVMVGAAVCVSISIAADMMSDLRTGHLVGSQPRRQQLAEILFVGIGPAVAIFTTLALARAFGLGNDFFPAAQGQALKAAIEGIQGQGLPFTLYGAGMAMGVLLGLGSFPGLGVLVGLSMYLPVMYIYAYGLGCIANLITEKIKGREWTSDWCIPFFGGCIIGESLLGLSFAGIVIWQTA